MDKQKLKKKIEELEAANQHVRSLTEEIKIMAEIPSPTEKQAKARYKKAIVDSHVAAVVKKRNDLIFRKNQEARNKSGK